MARRRSIFTRRKAGLKLKKTAICSSSAVLLVGLAVLIWLSFIRQGLLLFGLNTFLISQIGLVPVFFLPFTLIAAALMVAQVKTSLAQTHVLVGSLITLVALIGLLRGGTLGSDLWGNVAVFLSSPGAFLFFMAGLAIGGIVMFNIPLSDILNWIIALTQKTANINNRLPTTAISHTPLKVTGMTPVTKPMVSAPPNSSPVKPVADKSSQLTLTPPAASDVVWRYPPLSLLSENISGKADRGDVKANAAIIEKTLEAFGITARVVEVNMGPAVTQYALEVAIELPNHSPEFVSLRKVLESDPMKHHKSKLAVAMGLDVSGTAVVADIARMPHVLIAGSTGSGKSVCINAFLA